MQPQARPGQAGRRLGLLGSLLFAALLWGAGTVRAEDFALFVHYNWETGTASVLRVGSGGSVVGLPLPLETGSTGVMGQGSTLALPSPDQQWVAFTRENDLWLWDVARGAATRATQVGAPYDQRYASVFVLLTAWSADSRRLLFHVSAGNLECVDCDRPDFELRPAEYGFFFYDLESGAVRGLGSDLPGQFEAWLPDGEFLLSSPESRLTQAVLMRFNPAGRRTTPLKLPAGGYGQIDVSHSGQAFVTSFGLERDGRLASQILRVDLNSGQATALTPVGDWAAYQWPRFSPSGERVAYIRQLELPGSRWPPRVLMVGERRLLDCSEELKNLDFRWVNDSTLAASCGNEVFVVDADSGEVRGRQPVE